MRPREQEVLGNQWNVVGRRRQNLGDEQQKHDQRQQDRYTHRDLLTGVRRQVEHGCSLHMWSIYQAVYRYISTGRTRRFITQVIN